MMKMGSHEEERMCVCLCVKCVCVCARLCPEYSPASWSSLCLPLVAVLGTSSCSLRELTLQSSEEDVVDM